MLAELLGQFALQEGLHEDLEALEVDLLRTRWDTQHSVVCAFQKEKKNTRTEEHVVSISFAAALGCFAMADRQR